jgi:HEXXH motif-containing protein
MKIVSLDRIRANMQAVAMFADPASAISHGNRLSYFTSLNRLQRYDLRFSSERAEPLLDFAADPYGSEAILLDSLRRSQDFDAITPIGTVPSDEMTRIGDQYRSAHRLLGAYDSEILQVINDLIAWIIVVRTPGYVGGSFWHALGAIWISPLQDWTALNYAESLLHEGVHQAMFLDDMIHGLFAGPPAALSSDDALVASSIRKMRRPYDYAFHSATVSVALIDFFEHSRLTERAAELCPPLLCTLVELHEKRRFLSPRGHAILEDMIGRTASFSSFEATRQNLVLPN